MSEKASERRRYPRIEAHRRIVVRDSFGRIACGGETENLSEGGFLIVCLDQEYVPRKGRLFLQITVPDEKGPGTHVERHACRVCHVTQRADGKIALGLSIIDT